MVQTEPDIFATTPLPAPARGQATRAWLSTKIGLEGRILGTMMLVLIAAMGVASWIWASRSEKTIVNVMSDQATEVVYALSLASQHAIAESDAASLRHIGNDLLQSRDVLFVGFFDAQGKSLCVVYRRGMGKFQINELTPGDLESLGKVRMRDVPGLGSFFQIGAPVMLSSEPSAEHPAGSRLVGYVAMGTSPSRQVDQVRGVTTMAEGIGCVIVLLSLPAAYILVWRVFRPIRQLVAATNQIAAGDLDTRVAIERPDAIGDLARAFNEMVHTVKRQQEDLVIANDDLEEKVAQRTTQLETANKRLSSEIAEKEDFLRAVSHDLNAPLRNISGMASMLLMKHRDKFDEDVVHRLERIQKNVDVETDLIAELLELSRIKTRRQKMEMVEIQALVGELEEMFDNDLKTKQIKMVLDSPLPVLHGERARFRQVFQNLVDNAIKYMGDGPTKEIHVGCVVRASEAEFYVRDTGMGIDEDDLGKVFFVFRRGKSSATRNIAGKGVGLASVKSIVETYAGTIWATSKIGEGTTFFFTINGQYVPAATVAQRAVAAGEICEIGKGKSSNMSLAKE
jgi:signal transduction histidine kinase